MKKEIERHTGGQLHRYLDQDGRLARLELRSPNGKTLRITAKFDWDGQSGERRANGRGVSSGHYYYGGQEHLHTVWDDGPVGGRSVPFASWVGEIVAELTARARGEKLG